MSLLHQALRNEGIRRAIAQARRLSRTAERDNIVEGLHAVFSEQAPGILELKMIGNDRHPVRLGDCQQGFQIYQPSGLALRVGPIMGARGARAELVLAAQSRQGIQPASITLFVRRPHPARSEHLAVFPGHLPADEVIRHYLAALMPYIHDQQLGGER